MHHSTGSALVRRGTVSSRIRKTRAVFICLYLITLILLSTQPAVAEVTWNPNMHELSEAADLASSCIRVSAGNVGY